MNMCTFMNHAVKEVYATAHSAEWSIHIKL